MSVYGEINKAVSRLRCRCKFYVRSVTALTTQPGAFAQAGSAGGKLGKTDKSISGQRNEQTPKSHHGARAASLKASRPIGCFRDTNAPNDLNGYLERSQANTPDRCVAICKSKGFRYAGVQYGESCLCGNSYGHYGVANNCNMACTGNPNETCGGGFANYVYKTGVQ